MSGRPWVLAGAGSGGHWVPGVEVARALAARGGGAVFLAGRRLAERLILSRAPGPVEGLAGLPVRGGAAGRLELVRRLPVLTWRALRILHRRRAQGVVGLGGYGALPAALAAKALDLPLVLLEQNAVAGRATRLLAPWAAAVCCAYPEAARTLPRARCTGNPVAAPRRLARPLAARRFGLDPSRRTLLVVGGSQGALGLNRLLAEAAPALSPLARAWQILHLSGPREDGLQARYGQLGWLARVVPFLEDMPAAYSLADLVVSRAGATTLAELAAWGLPAVLVPYPYHRDGHQRANAGLFVRGGAAALLEERAAGSAARLAAVLRALMADAARRAAMARRARRLARPEATAAVLAVLEDATAKRQKDPTWAESASI